MSEMPAFRKTRWKTILFDRPEAPAPAWTKWALSFAGILALAAACFFFLAGTTKNWDAVGAYHQVFWMGWLNTLWISAVSLALSLVIGVVAALARRSTFLPLRGLAVGYIEIVRGMPLLVLLLFLFYVVASAAQWNDRISVGILSLSLFSGAYIAEIVRAGIGSVGASQLESARAIGLTPFQTHRFVIFPQALRQSLPPLAGQFASIIKDSSLLSILGIGEFTYMAQQINSATYSTLESYLPLALGYLILTLPILLLSRQLENRLRFET